MRMMIPTTSMVWITSASSPCRDPEKPGRAYMDCGIERVAPASSELAYLLWRHRSRYRRLLHEWWVGSRRPRCRSRPAKSILIAGRRLFFLRHRAVLRRRLLLARRLSLLLPPV